MNISKSKRCSKAKSSADYFHRKTKILANFQIWISVPLTIVTPFLPFKGTTQAYLLKMSMTHDKNLVPLLYLLINCISARSVLQVLSFKKRNSSFSKFFNNWFMKFIWKLSVLHRFNTTTYRFFIKKLVNYCSWSSFISIKF